MRIPLLTLLLLPAFALATHAEAQDPASSRDAAALAARAVMITGRVVDQVSGEPLRTAHVSLRRAGEEAEIAWEGLSGPGGQFQSPRIAMGSYELRVQLIGFAAISHHLTFSEDGAVEIRVEMVPAAIELQPIVATAIRQSRLETNGFFERRQLGVGTTMTREEIESKGSARVSELFFGVPGVRVIPSRPGRPGDIRLRNGCRPQVVLDGTALSMPIAIDELLSVGEVEALELYQGFSGPVQTLRYTCGTVMAWTRQGNAVEGSPFSWRKMFSAVGLLALLIAIAPR